MVKKLITEISEEDFRKLDIKIKRNERIQIDEKTSTFKMVERSINEILDKQIYATLENGYASDLEDLKTPVTIAIHEDDGYYLDKFMNRYTGAQTYQIGWGIDHLYSSRDYYEAHDDYWRVKKDETKVIYRVYLKDEWIEKFVLKHKEDVIDWPYQELPEGVGSNFIEAKLVIKYDLQEDGSWKEICRYGLFKYEYTSMHIPVDENGKSVKIECKEDD